MKHPKRLLTGIVVAFSMIAVLLSGCTTKPTTSSSAVTTKSTAATTRATTATTKAATSSTALITVPTTAASGITSVSVTTKSSGT